jgi:hypothetical protein
LTCNAVRFLFASGLHACPYVLFCINSYRLLCVLSHPSSLHSRLGVKYVSPLGFIITKAYAAFVDPSLAYDLRNDYYQQPTRTSRCRWSACKLICECYNIIAVSTSIPTPAGRVVGAAVTSRISSGSMMTLLHIILGIFHNWLLQPVVLPT